MNNTEKILIGRYYVRLKEVHINWTHKTGPKRGKEAYIPIPAKYAYAFNILKSDIYTCTDTDSGKSVLVKAAGSQSRREYAKQFQGANDLRILYDWYDRHHAAEGDWVVVSIFEGNCISIEYVSQENIHRISDLHLDGDNGRPEELETVPSTCQTGLRLVSLKVKDGDRIICDYHFFPDNFTSYVAEPLTTLIIGANSTGKSFVMKILSEVFQAVNNESVNRVLQYDSYCLTYFLDGDFIEIEIINRTIIIHKNNVLIEESAVSVLPSKVLAVSFMLNDKFAFKAESRDKPSMYEYLGLRQSSNASWINALRKRVAESLLELAGTDKLWPIIRALSSHFNLDPQISIAYELCQKEFTLDQVKEMGNSDLINRLIELATRLTEKETFRKTAIARMKPEDFATMAAFLKGLGVLDPFISDSKKLIFGHTFSETTDREDMQKIQADYNVLMNLSALQIIEDVTLYVYKYGHKYSFDDCSSGEKHILFAFLNIARCIRDNSLILIDEPEISLHPNWQMIYITALKQLFREFPSCHFVIASHSPYLVSDLSPDSSSLIVLSMEDGVRSAVTLDYSTYAWSAENILYNVFQVRTTRNFYFDLDLRELLCKVSEKDEDLARIKELYDKLSQYTFRDEDPLMLILKNVEEYIENAESK